MGAGDDVKSRQTAMCPQQGQQGYKAAYWLKQLNSKAKAASWCKPGHSQTPKALLVESREGKVGVWTASAGPEDHHKALTVCSWPYSHPNKVLCCHLVISDENADPNQKVPKVTPKDRLNSKGQMTRYFKSQVF